MINLAVHFALLLAMPPLLLGVINKTKAWFGGRRGAPFLQPYYDIAKLLRKGAAISRTVSWIFIAGPAAGLAAALLAGCILPFGHYTAPLAFTGDFILFAYLFGLNRFFTAAAALDTGSAFEGMGASRETAFAVLSEPALFFAFLSLSRLSGSLSLSGMADAFSGALAADPGGGVLAALALTAIGLFIVLLAETCRLPVDDPTTHLELTMIHEAMVLDHSGPLLGAIEYAAAVKLYVLGGFLVRLALPASGYAWLDWIVMAAALLGLSAGVGVLESVTARLRMRRVPYLLVSALLLCAAGLVLMVRP